VSSSYAVTRCDAPKTSEANLSIVVVADADLSRDLPKAVRMVAARQPRLPRRLSAAIVAELIERGHAEERNRRAQPK